MTEPKNTITLKVSPAVAKVVGKTAPRELQLEAARGGLPLSAPDLVTALFFLCHGGDTEVRSLAVKTLKELSMDILVPLVADPNTNPRILDMIVQVRSRDHAVIERVLKNPSLSGETLRRLASRCEGDILQLLTAHRSLLDAHPEASKALAANPAAATNPPVSPPPPETTAPPVTPTKDDASQEPAEEEKQEEELNLSKYQKALEMGVAEKIKMALTGDKEWRSIFLKDPNKLVSGAAMKNPRISDSEVLAVAKNKSSNDELIRLITLNKDWLKHYEIKKALVLHPKTPLPKALRYMTVLSDKDLKYISTSKGISQVVVVNARRMLIAKMQKK